VKDFFKGKKGKKKEILLIGILMSSAFPLRADEALLIFSHYGKENAPPEVISDIEYTVYAVDAAFYAAGIEARAPYIEGESGDLSTEKAREQCESAGVRWAIMVNTFYTNGRLSWRFALYDAPENMIRAVENFFTALSASVSTFGVIDTSAEKVAENYRRADPTADFNGKTAVSIAQKFAAPEDGIAVYFGGESGFYAGVIENREMIAPLLLFVENEPVYGTASKDGYWSKPFTLPNGVTGETVHLPKLVKKTRQSLSFMTEMRGSKYGVDFDYRLHLLPDRWFFKCNYALWNEKLPVERDRGQLCQEMRLGTGLYLLPKNTYPFRLLAGTGASAVFLGGQISFFADPLWLGAEYHFSRFALVGEVRFPELFTYSRGAFGNGDPDSDYYVSFGVMLKW
jgi:hypothetical protein